MKTGDGVRRSGSQIHLKHDDVDEELADEQGMNEESKKQKP